jgi:hypothetical protein
MSLGLFELSGWRGTRTPTGRPVVAFTRPALENLEERTVMASPASLGVGSVLSALGHQHLPVDVTSVTTQVVNGVTQLVANGTIAGQAFSTPVTVSASQASTNDVPILHLHLAPIDLNVLGLQVKTSEICLNVDASPGRGRLLGNLLAGLANGLNQGGALGDLLGGLSGSELGALTRGLTHLFDSGLRAVTARATESVLTSTTNILHLSVGPLNLNLLGLKVNLDNCAGGPVTVDVNAISGPGNLLGNLLSDVVHLADIPNVGALDHLLSDLGHTLNRLGL